MLVVVNASSGGGRGLRRWQRLEPYLADRLQHADVEMPASVQELSSCVAEACRAGRSCVVAAGGDGTVHAVLNALMQARSKVREGDVSLGAVGLGSSNDFHKPRVPARLVRGVPIALSRNNSRWVDVGCAEFVDAGSGKQCKEYFLLNASFGVVADGNARFNAPGTMLRWCKKVHSELAVMWAALESICKVRAQRCVVRLDDVLRLDLQAVNLAVLKRRYFAGGMHYDTAVAEDDGNFTVNLWGDMTPWEVLRTALALYRGSFQGRAKTRTLRARSLHVELPEPQPLELDGEVVWTKDVAFSLLPRALRVCG